MKFRRSMRGKMTLAVTCTTVVFLVVNLFLFSRINEKVNALQGVYATNIRLGEYSQALAKIRDTAYEYLNARSEEAYDSYAAARDTFMPLATRISSSVTDSAPRLMEKNIRGLSLSYIELMEEAVSRKRVLDAEGCAAQYAIAQAVYADLLSTIGALDSLRFEANSENFFVLLGSVRTLEIYMVCALMCVALYIMVILYAIMGGITKPLVQLAEKAAEVGEGNLSVQLEEPRTRDEVGTVTRAFNGMVGRLNENIRRTRESLEEQLRMKENELEMERLLREARLQYYQAQIDPHFLFNTLNAGQQLAMMEGAERTYDFMDNLACFCRYRLRRSGETATLREEVELVRNYMYIMNVRYGGELQMDMQLDQKLLAVEFPAMILQPIVENAVRYGLSGKEEDKRVTLDIHKENGFVCVSIADNGCGMEPERLRQVQSEETSSAGGNGIGLANVRARLRLFYGREDVMRIESDGSGKGTSVHIRVPMEKGERTHV